MSNFNEGDLVYVEYIDDDNNCLYFAKVNGFDDESGKVVVDDVYIMFDANGDDIMKNYKLDPKFIVENFKNEPLESIKERKPSLFV